MIKVDSNIGHVTRQLQGVREGLPRAVAAALNPAKWIGQAKDVAEKTLFALAGPDEWDQVRDLARRVTAGPLPGAVGMVLALDARKDRSLFAEQQTIPGVNTTPGALNLTGQTPSQFMDLLRRWVAAPEEDGGKRRDERDSGKTDEQIVEHLMRVLFAPTGNVPGSESGLAAARAGLLPHIVAFYQQEMAGVGVSPERLEEWLRAVLAAWRDMVSDEITLRIRAELKAKKFP